MNFGGTSTQGDQSRDEDSVSDDDLLNNDVDGFFLSIRKNNSSHRDHHPDHPHQQAQQSDTNPSGASFWALMSYVICLTAANLSWGWPVVLYKGFWSAFFALIVTCLLFVSLNCCIAEMLSIFPFSGGTYGFARVTAGPYIGFLIGCFEGFGNICYILVTMISLGQFVSQIIGQDSKYEPIYWFLVYVLCIVSECLHRSTYFQMINLFAFYIVMVYLLYIIISFQNIDVDKYLPPNAIDSTYANGAYGFFQIFPYSSFFFFGMEMIPLVCNEVQSPKKAMPKAILSISVILVVCSFLFLFLYFCQYPSYPLGDLTYIQTHLLPFNSGFSNTFGISNTESTIISFPLSVISVLIYFHVCCKQFKALSASKLFPSFFTSPPLVTCSSRFSFPDNSSLFIFLFGFIVLIIGYIKNSVDTYSVMFYNLYAACLMGTYSTYLIIFVSFLIFRRKYASLERQFMNPFGTVSAYFGIFLTALLLIPVIAYSDVNYIGVKIFISFVGIMSIYYFFYAKRKQSFSEEEQKILFVVYLMKANDRKEYYRYFHHSRGFFSSIPFIISRIISFFFFSSSTKGSQHHHHQFHQEKMKVHPIAYHHSSIPTTEMVGNGIICRPEEPQSRLGVGCNSSVAEKVQTEKDTTIMTTSIAMVHSFRPSSDKEKDEKEGEDRTPNGGERSIRRELYSQESNKTNDLYSLTSFRG